MSRIVKIFAGLYSYARDDINDSDYVIGVDKGAYELVKNGAKIDLAVGDFDSINSENFKLIKEKINQVFVLEKRKDDTDLAYVFKHFIKSDDEIHCYGCLGERLDHSFANILLMAKYKDYKIAFYNHMSKILILNKGDYEIEKSKYTYFSVYSIVDSIVSLENCEYPLNKYRLSKLDTLITSNEVNTNNLKISIHEGCVFMIQSIYDK